MKYRNWLGEDSKKHDSRTQERYFDCSGLPEGYEIRGRTIYDIIIPLEKEKGKGVFLVKMENSSVPIERVYSLNTYL